MTHNYYIAKIELEYADYLGSVHKKNIFDEFATFSTALEYANSIFEKIKSVCPALKDCKISVTKERGLFEIWQSNTHINQRKLMVGNGGFLLYLKMTIHHEFMVVNEFCYDTTDAFNALFSF